MESQILRGHINEILQQYHLRLRAFLDSLSSPWSYLQADIFSKPKDRALNRNLCLFVSSLNSNKCATLCMFKSSIYLASAAKELGMKPNSSSFTEFLFGSS